ncbi:MAG: ribosome-inactivating family protein [Alphaproteobacteria bacterium]|nr:ribosome-inactivating family protein [Alphaproteobacteria bacterium]
MGNRDLVLNTTNTRGAISNLSRYTGGTINSAFTDNLVRVIFITSESLRFRTAFYASLTLANNREIPNPQNNWQTFRPSLNNWGSLSNIACLQDTIQNPPSPPYPLIGEKDDIRISLSAGNTDCNPQ